MKKWRYRIRMRVNRKPSAVVPWEEEGGDPQLTSSEALSIKTAIEDSEKYNTAADSERLKTVS